MLGEERKAKIREHVLQNASATVQEIRDKFGISESTVRRDLKELEEANLIRRTHGGAVSLQVVNFEPTYTEKEDQFRREKGAIARMAAAYVKEGDTILIDSGTTTYHLVEELKRFSKLTVVTNSLLFAQELQSSPGIDVVVIGGTLRKETLALVGPLAEQALDRMRVDTAFVAANGVDLYHGLTTPNLVEAQTKWKMIQIAKQSILLTDHSKFGQVAFAKIARLEEIDKVITDSALDESVIGTWKQHGVDLIVAH
jgi:DeoR family transcriptional regulator, fructose operon transcriptional repressor